MNRRKEKLVLFAAEHGVALVLARHRRNGVDLCNPLCVPYREAKPQSLALTAESVVATLAEHVKKSGWRGMPVHCLIGGPTVTCQYFEMPALKPLALQSAIQLKLSQQLHYSVNDALLWVGQPQPVRAGGELTCVGAAAVNRVHAGVVISAAERMGLLPTQISPGASGIAALGSAVGAVKGEGLEAIVYLAEYEGLLLIYRDGQLFVSTEISVRLADLTAALTRPIIKGDDVLQLDESQARRLRDTIGIPEPGIDIPEHDVRTERISPVLEPVLQQLNRQLTQWISYARTSCGGKTVSSLKIVGPAARIPGLAANLGHRLHCESGNLSWNAEWGSIIGESSFQADEFAPSVGVALATEPLPDLSPPELRRRQKLERIRRFSLLLAPSATAALLLVTFALHQINGGLKTARASQAELLRKSQVELIHWQQWQADAARCRAKQLNFADFARTTPNWEGAFKELSHILPDSVQLSGLVARVVDARIVLRLSANVRDIGSESDFDEIVEQTLGSLKASPFFDEVEVLSAARSPEAQNGANSGGSLIADLKLTYVVPASATKEKP